MGTTGSNAQREPWNEGKIVGQKAATHTAGQEESFAMGSLQDDQMVAALFKVRTAIELFEGAPANSA